MPSKQKPTPKKSDTIYAGDYYIPSMYQDLLSNEVKGNVPRKNAMEPFYNTTSWHDTKAFPEMVQQFSKLRQLLKDKYGFNIGATEMYRSPAGSAAGIAQGKTNVAEPWNSQHNYGGRGIDIHVVRNGKPRLMAFNDPEYPIVIEEGFKQGLINPPYMQQGGTGNKEPWHFTYGVLKDAKNPYLKNTDVEDWQGKDLATIVPKTFQDIKDYNDATVAMVEPSNVSVAMTGKYELPSLPTIPSGGADLIYETKTGQPISTRLQEEQDRRRAIDETYWANQAKNRREIVDPMLAVIEQNRKDRMNQRLEQLMPNVINEPLYALQDTR
jgi:hypothetical protein